MQESWAYYFGKIGISGRDYASVAPVAGCGGRNIIWVGNNYDIQASPKDGTDRPSARRQRWGANSSSGKNANPAATTEQKASIADTLTTTCGASALDTNEGKGAYALNWARYMKAQGSPPTRSVLPSLVALATRTLRRPNEKNGLARGRWRRVFRGIRLHEFKIAFRPRHQQDPGGQQRLRRRQPAGQRQHRKAPF